MTTSPDIFTNVHQGIRHALFQVCIDLGRAGDDATAAAAARARLREVLHFVAHHGENEDRLLLPLLERRAPQSFARMQEAHGQIGVALDALVAHIEPGSMDELYLRACDFVTLYLEHMREEEQLLEPAIRAALSTDELADFGRQSVARTTPADQRMMLGWMLPAMRPAEVEAFLARLPAPLSTELRSLAAPRALMR